MNLRTLKKLEFDKIITMLLECCACSLGKEYAEGLEPSLDMEVVILGQRETTEGREMLRFHPDLPFGGITDVRQPLKRVGVGGILEPEDLLALAETFYGGRRLKQFILEAKETFPILQELAQTLGNFRPIEEQINRSILPGGEIADNASEDLLKVRRQIRSYHNRVKEKIDHILRGTEWQKMLQEAIVTVRGDRYVVPVKQEYRGQFPGIIHDQSASGATLFIEPMEVVEINNEVRRLTVAEKQEIAKILAGITGQIHGRLEEIQTTIEVLGRLDFIFAKARLSQKMDAWEPKLNDWGYLNIIKGRHPLLRGNVVPVSIQLGGEFSILVITGPNTGGKTVSLKTVGLFILMTQAGLHIPAEHGSEIGFYTKIFSDIGDEQSIEQSLSTFSSHMTNIVDILKQADAQTLVLMDELGAGTDPAEGAALAMAILDELYNRGSKTIATTHYSELKDFAYSREGIENASVEFDVATLRPTYRLLIGQPGSSNAFEIAYRLGLSKQVVERARSFQTKEERDIATLIKNLEETQKAAEAERLAAEAVHREANRIREEYRALQDKLEGKREAILAKAKEQAQSIVKLTRQETEQVLTELKEELAKETGQAKLNITHKARGKLRNMQNEQTTDFLEAGAAPGQVPNNIKPGQSVFLPKLNQKGIALGRASGSGEVQVQVGIMKLNVPLKDLRTVTEEPTPTTNSGSGRLMSTKAQGVSRELDLRGCRVDEALALVDKYLDDAILAGLPTVQLIHGKGTGALRAAIKEELTSHPLVKSYRLGESGEGGDGVTVVEFKGG
jgi:DNA mismatch repair protein MutS2